MYFQVELCHNIPFFKPGGPIQLLLECLQNQKNYNLLPARRTTLWSDHHHHPCLVDTSQSNWLQKLLLLLSFQMSRDVQKSAIHPIEQQGQSSPSEHGDEDSFPKQVCFTQIEDSVMIQQYWVGIAASLHKIECIICTSNMSDIRISAEKDISEYTRDLNQRLCRKFGNPNHELSFKNTWNKFVQIKWLSFQIGLAQTKFCPHVLIYLCYECERTKVESLIIQDHHPLSFYQMFLFATFQKR